MNNAIWMVDTVSRVVHVGTAITLVGGAVFLTWVLIPSAKNLEEAGELDETTHQNLSNAINSRWKRFVHLGIALFLISGFYNFFRALAQHQGDSLYHALIGIKILLALFVFFIGSALVGRSPALQPMRQNRSRWLRVLVLVALVIVAISGYVKVRGIP